MSSMNKTIFLLFLISCIFTTSFADKNFQSKFIPRLLGDNEHDNEQDNEQSGSSHQKHSGSSNPGTNSNAAVTNQNTGSFNGPNFELNIAFNFATNNQVSMPGSTLNCLSAPSWIEWTPYQTTFTLTQPLTSLRVTLHVPLAGLRGVAGTNGGRGRYRLLLDGSADGTSGTEIAQSMMYRDVAVTWKLEDIILDGVVYNVKKGTHTINAWVRNDGTDAVCFPHYNPGEIEGQAPNFVVYLHLSGQQ